MLSIQIMARRQMVKSIVRSSIKDACAYRFERKSSGDTLMSLQICLSKSGERSLEPCIGTVVARPSWWRNCWCEPFCRASAKPSFSRIATTSLGLRTGRLPPTSQRPLAGFQRISILASGDRHLRAQVQPLPSGFPEVLRGSRPGCELLADPGRKPRNSLWRCRARLLLCRHALSCVYYTPVVAASSLLPMMATIKEAQHGASFISISTMVRERGVEPPSLAALVPQTSVYTIPPLARAGI